jgi:hypothetical protein
MECRTISEPVSIGNLGKFLRLQDVIECHFSRADRTGRFIHATRRILSSFSKQSRDQLVRSDENKRVFRTVPSIARFARIVVLTSRRGDAVPLAQLELHAQSRVRERTRGLCVLAHGLAVRIE